MSEIINTYEDTDVIYDNWDEVEYRLRKCVCSRPNLQLQKGCCDEQLLYWIICTGCCLRTAPVDSPQEAVTLWGNRQYDNSAQHNNWYSDLCLCSSPFD